MQQCYDWNKNVLSFMDVNDNNYHLEFKGKKTIVSGESATGKTLICSMLRNYIEDYNDGLKPYNTDNIFILSRENKDKLKEQQGKLVIIDRAEFLLDSEMIDFINSDRGINRYLIFVRKPMGIELSPNYFATLYKDDNTLRLKYEMNVKGWN